MATADKTIELSGIGTLSGTPEQVRTRLGRLHAERVIALTLEHGNEAAVRALAETVANLAPLVRTILERRQDEALHSIIEALVPEVPLPRHKLVEARMTAEARRAVLESGDWLTAAQIAEIAGFSASNPSAQPNKWKRDGQIFAVRHRGVDYFPGYALHPSTDYRPAKGFAQVLAVFGERKDDWGLAYWFASVNSFLGGKRPQDLLIDQPARVIAAAEDEVAGVLHG
ncbi:hypothetical protein OZ411_09770 [Bradyrhizobium sp. Arg237L]|uniref:hypothetical protein n=1 Tax=Bradyrhizobium sp. Arg237L TaxID=3003352 RepID=UPI00249F508C|nr:hypothetical protein [Bradyrhizobium sp. Arg237L]MDI4233097.1 hypothetical protein [Bradyrhizobium sp. Arg237L]